MILNYQIDLKPKHSNVNFHTQLRNWIRSRKWLSAHYSRAENKRSWMKRFYYFSQQRYAKSEMQTDYMYLV